VPSPIRGGNDNAASSDFLSKPPAQNVDSDICGYCNAQLFHRWQQAANHLYD
jgi:hypothetical protein